MPARAIGVVEKLLLGGLGEGLLGVWVGVVVVGGYRL